MRRLRIGIDCDGVLADFKLAYTTEMQRLYPDIPYLVHKTEGMLAWDETAHPFVTPEMAKETWKYITMARDWWLTLAPIPTFTERTSLTHLAKDQDVYIITARANTLGDSVVHQTWRWLGNQGIHGASVILAKQKGSVARALKLDYFLDDKPENCEDVADCAEDCRVFLREWNWNREIPLHWSIGSYKNLGDFINRVAEDGRYHGNE